jgi:hypothetical protein
MAKRQYLLILPLVAFLGLLPRGARAYQTDVHFNLTYVLCRLAGLKKEDALWIAVADQSMDDNKCTTAYGDGPWDTLTTISWLRNGVDWHAFNGTDDISKAHLAIEKRMGTLKDRVFAAIPTSGTSDRDKTLLALIAMGQFLHFEQDFFAHRQLADSALHADTWRPYGPFKGHFTDGHKPDYVGGRPRLAALMIKDSYKYIRDFSRKLYGKDLAQAVSDSSLDTLVLNMTQSYFVTPITEFTTQAYVDVDTVPTQAKVVEYLSKGLLSIKSEIESKGIETGWIMQLPMDPEDAAGLHTLRLPYDVPTTPLQSVKTMIDAWK